MPVCCITTVFKRAPGLLNIRYMLLEGMEEDVGSMSVASMSDGGTQGVLALKVCVSVSD